VTDGSKTIWKESFKHMFLCACHQCSVCTTGSSYVSKWHMHQSQNINNLPKSAQILLSILFSNPVVLVLFQDLASSPDS